MSAAALLPLIDWKAVGVAIERARPNSLRDASLALGIHYQQLWRLERGECHSADVLLPVCLWLGLDPFVLTGLKPAQARAA